MCVMKGIQKAVLSLYKAFKTFILNPYNESNNVSYICVVPFTIYFQFAGRLQLLA